MIAYLRFVRSALVIMGAVIGMTGCQKDNALLGPDGGGGGSACKNNGDCMAPTATCDVNGSKTCVQCLPATPATANEACPASAPVCDLNKTCRICTANSECPSDACLPSGMCALEAEVIYAAANGTGSTCAKAAPCSLATAIGQVAVAKPTVRLDAGTFMDVVIALSGTTATLIGEPGTVLRGKPGAGGQPIVSLAAASNVTLSELEFQSSDKAGIKVDGGSTLLVNRCKIKTSKEEGVLISDGTVTISKSEVSAGKALGVSLAKGELSIAGSTISANLGGGIAVSNLQKFSILNSFIVGNSGGGGIFALNPGAGSKLEFNTIVDNVDGTGAADAGGVTCDDATFTFPNNLIFRNTGGQGPGKVQTFGTCTYGNSFNAPGTGPTDATLAFRKDTMPRDYHLTATSPTSVRNGAGATCTNAIDVDGDSRPQEGACDLGADEFKP
jgi:Right handed beta helix region